MHVKQFLRDSFVAKLARNRPVLAPYIRDWMAGAVSWHPSVVAHNMRGSQHAYFWLLNWAEAITDLKSQLSLRALEAVGKDIDHLVPLGKG